MRPYPLLLTGALVAGLPLGSAADISPEANACIDELRARVGDVGGEVLGEEFSEAATMVRLRDAEGNAYECLVWSGPEIAGFRQVGGEGPMSDDGGGAMDGAGPPSTTQQVRFEPGSIGTSVAGVLGPDASARYLLGAQEGQLLSVQVEHRGGPRLDYRILNPDGSVLLDRISTAQPYRGELWQSGDHTVELLNPQGNDGEYVVTFTIE